MCAKNKDHCDSVMCVDVRIKHSLHPVIDRHEAMAKHKPIKGSAIEKYHSIMSQYLKNRYQK